MCINFSSFNNVATSYFHSFNKYNCAAGLINSVVEDLPLLIYLVILSLFLNVSKALPNGHVDLSAQFSIIANLSSKYRVRPLANTPINELIYSVPIDRNKYNSQTKMPL